MTIGRAGRGEDLGLPVEDGIQLLRLRLEDLGSRVGRRRPACEEATAGQQHRGNRDDRDRGSNRHHSPHCMHPTASA